MVDTERICPLCGEGSGPPWARQVEDIETETESESGKFGPLGSGLVHKGIHDVHASFLETPPREKQFNRYPAHFPFSVVCRDWSQCCQKYLQVGSRRDILVHSSAETCLLCGRLGASIICRELPTVFLHLPCAIKCEFRFERGIDGRCLNVLEPDGFRFHPSALIQGRGGVF